MMDTGPLGVGMESPQAPGLFWYRGEARLMVIPFWDMMAGNLAARPPFALERPLTADDAKLVGFGRLEGRTVGEVRAHSYNVSRVRQAALKQLVSLTDNPSDDAVLAFARAYGPLVSFRAWLLAQLPALAGAKPGVYATRSADREVGWPQYYRLERGEARAIYGPADVDLYLDWLDSRALNGDATYVTTLLDRLRAGQGTRGALRRPKEPLSFYLWAADMLGRLGRELREEPPMSGEVSLWLEYRLAESRLGLVSRKPARVGLRATSLIGYLTNQAVLDDSGALPDVRTCRECGEAFLVQDARQRFCSRLCQDRHKKRRQRREAAERRQKAVLAPPPSA